MNKADKAPATGRQPCMHDHSPEQHAWHDLLLPDAQPARVQEGNPMHSMDMFQGGMGMGMGMGMPGMGMNMGEMGPGMMPGLPFPGAAARLWIWNTLGACPAAAQPGIRADSRGATA